jgi:hypothetical protein
VESNTSAEVWLLGAEVQHDATECVRLTQSTLSNGGLDAESLDASCHMEGLIVEVVLPLE